MKKNNIETAREFCEPLNIYISGEVASIEINELYKLMVDYANFLNSDSEGTKSANEMLLDRFRELTAENEQLEARNKRQHEALTIRTKFSDGYSNPDQAKLAQLENTVLHLTRALSELVGSRAVG